MWDATKPAWRTAEESCGCQHMGTVWPSLGCLSVEEEERPVQNNSDC